MANTALAERAACTPLFCNPPEAWQRAGREQAWCLGLSLPGLGEVTHSQGWSHCPVCQAEWKEAAGFLPAHLEKGWSLPLVCLWVKRVGLGNCSCEAACIWRITWAVSVLCILFLLFPSFHWSSLKIMEYLREVWSWSEIIFLLIRRHGLCTISPKQWSIKPPKPLLRAFLTHLSLIYLFAVHCTPLLLSARSLLSQGWMLWSATYCWWLGPCLNKSLSCTRANFCS